MTAADSGTRTRRVGPLVGAGILLAALIGVIVFLTAGSPSADGQLAAAQGEGAAGAEDPDGAEDAEAAAEAEAREQARVEAERIAAEQAERLIELEERRAAAEEAAEAERVAAEEAAEAERRAAEEAAEAERRAEEERQQLVAAQERLRELGYLVGPADGQQGQQTTAAIMAFQAVNGLSVDGVLGPQTLATLDAPNRQPQLRGGAATRIEVDMDLQVLHLVEGDQRVATMKTSTGRGGTFESEAGETLRAETPVGTFTIDRRIQGEHQSSYGIGGMWDPMYFYGPWAIHGSPNVPAGPASAGCVRLSMADGTWLFNRVPNGTPVVLYGGTHVFTP